MIWKDYLYFTKTERRGIKILTAVLILSLAIPHMAGLLSTKHDYDFSDTADAAASLQAIASLTNTPEHSPGEPGRLAGFDNTEEMVLLTPNRFDPNELSAADWANIGFPERLGRAIQNYLQAGGTFRFREDLKRIYLMQDAWYEHIEAYIDLPSRSEINGSPPNHSRSAQYNPDRSYQGHVEETAASSRQTEEHSMAENAGLSLASSARYPTNRLPPVDINRADTTELTKIRGIGPAFSRRIRNYRELLGGFVCYSQLLEVFGMDSVRWEQLVEQIVIDSLAVQKIQIHHADFSTFVRHPYIDRNLANALTNFVGQHKPIDSLPQLRQLALITDSLYARLAPYLCCE